MSTLYSAGEHLNHLARALSVAASSANANFPIANLFDGYPGVPFRFNAAGADDAITVDNALWSGGGFEGASLSADGWTATGTAAKSTAQHYVGAASCLCADGDTAYRDVIVRAGGTYTVSARARAASGTPSAIVYIQNRDTGKFWTGTAWSASPTAALDGVPAADWTTWYGAVGVATFAVESAALCLGPLTTLGITVGSFDGAGSYFDEVAIWPRVSLLHVAGHNIDPAIAVQLRSSTDAFGAVDTLEGTATKQRDAFAMALTSGNRDRRYWRVKFSGTNSAAIELGELILTEYRTLSTAARYPLRISYLERQSRAFGTAYSLSQRPERTLDLEYEHSTLADYQEMRDELLFRVRGRLYPIVIIPDDQVDSDIAVYGTCESAWEVARPQNLIRTHQLRVVELPFSTQAP